MDDSTGTRPVNSDAYNAYAAEMQRRLDERPHTIDYHAMYRARRDAHIAKQKVDKRKAEEAARAATSESTDKPDSDGPVDPLTAWQPRKQRIKKEEPSEVKSVLTSAQPVKDKATIPVRAARLPAREDELAGSSARGAVAESSARPNNVPRRSGGALTNEQTIRQGKRPANSNPNDDRRHSAPKQARRASTASSSASPVLPEARATGAGREPPGWYKQLRTKAERSRFGDAETQILRLKSSINKVKQAANGPSVLATEGVEIAERLHALVFLAVDGQLLRNKKILDNDSGLPQLFDSAFSGGVIWPWYIKADAEELYNKWCTGEFETDLYRGLVRGLPGAGKKGKGKADGSVADKLADGHDRFKLMDPKQHGNGLLLNGAWWPSQLAALRDGGHGSSQGGITGNAMSGAYSVIMAGGLDPSGKPYPNEDKGSEVLYCGTDNKNKKQNQPSPDTNALLANFHNKKPVRSFRSHNLDSKHAPELGFRYDGLYSVAGYTDMDLPENTRRRHRFKLVRCAGQDPIRSEGSGKRPTKQEIDEYGKDKKNRGR